jgi:hypothetical protein
MDNSRYSKQDYNIEENSIVNYEHKKIYINKAYLIKYKLPIL